MVHCFSLNFIGENLDFQILNDTTFIITPNVSQVCLHFEAFDDDSAEDPEQVLVVITMNNNIVIGYTMVVITNNDGMCIIFVMCIAKCVQV